MMKGYRDLLLLPVFTFLLLVSPILPSTQVDYDKVLIEVRNAESICGALSANGLDIRRLSGDDQFALFVDGLSL